VSVIELLYACPAWSRYITASDRKRVDAFLCRSNVGANVAVSVHWTTTALTT